MPKEGWIMEILKNCLFAFIFGGSLCVIGQIFIDLTKLTPARILVSYVVIGVILGSFKIYDPLLEIFGCGASVPLTGFGNLLANGVREAIVKQGALGIISGGLTGAAAGITAAIVSAFIIALITKPKIK